MHKLFARLALAAVITAGSTAFAADPTVNDIYQATASGRLDQAQTMVAEVLRDHPNSAKAHFVAAEVYARAGRSALAREQLSEAQTLDPKGAYANPRAISELRAELNQGGARAGSVVRRPAGGFPLVWVLVLVGAVVALWALFRRRAVAQPMAVPGPMGAGPYANPGAYGGPYGYGPQAPGGSGLGHSLATGLAMGAGVVAGEELVRHFADGDRRGPASGFEESGNSPVNGDMGGNDFGTSDPGSWDDGGSFGGGGGGDDWS